MSEAQRINDWHGYRSDGSVIADRGLLGATLWRLKRAEPTELSIVVPDDSHIICVHLGGEIDWSATYDDRRYRNRCTPGTLNLARAGERASIVYRNADAAFLHFYVPIELTRRYLVDDGGRPIDLIDPQNARDARIASLARVAAREMAAGAAGRLRLDGAGLTLMAHLVDRWSTFRGPRPSEPTALASWQVKRMTDRLIDTLDDEPSLAELGALVDLSPAYVCRAFAAATGLPPHRWLTAHRIARARAMLADGNLSVADIASAIGYADPSYFARIFKRATGVTPLNYRRERQG